MPWGNVLFARRLSPVLPSPFDFLISSSVLCNFDLVSKCLSQLYIYTRLSPWMMPVQAIYCNPVDHRILTSSTHFKLSIAVMPNRSALQPRTSRLAATIDSHARPESRFDAFLNCDVRQIMYDFMRSNFPPFGNNNSYIGYALSCTSAHH